MSNGPDPAAFLETLASLPPYIGVTFRGCDERSHERWPGRSQVIDRLLPTSRDPRVATENFTTDAVYAILSRTGRSIERFSAAEHEREVVLLPGSVLTLLTRVRHGDLAITVVEEYDPAEPEGATVDLVAVGARISRAIEAARSRAPVPEPKPGKFAGDIG